MGGCAASHFFLASVVASVVGRVKILAVVVRRVNRINLPPPSRAFLRVSFLAPLAPLTRSKSPLSLSCFFARC